MPPVDNLSCHNLQIILYDLWIFKIFKFAKYQESGSQISPHAVRGYHDMTLLFCRMTFRNQTLIVQSKIFNFLYRKHMKIAWHL